LLKKLGKLKHRKDRGEKGKSVGGKTRNPELGSGTRFTGNRQTEGRNKITVPWCSNCSEGAEGKGKNKKGPLHRNNV